MLHARARYALYFGEVRTLIFQSLQNQIDGLEEQSDGCEDFALVGIREDAFLDAILGEVGIEIDFGFVDELQVGADNNACTPRVTSVKMKGGGVALAGYLSRSPFSCCVLRSNPKN